jgi:hypothetical protein
MEKLEGVCFDTDNLFETGAWFETAHVLRQLCGWKARRKIENSF